MPSIRVKGQVYSTLDAISTNDDTLRLRGEPTSPRNTHSHTIPHRSSLPLLPRGLLNVPSPSLHEFGRPRSASSRVYAHCINNTSRNSQHLQPPSNPLLVSNTKFTPTSNVDNASTSQEIEGALSDVRIPSHVPRIAESSINTANEDSQFSGHHHDDVVEHLDVIGISLLASHFSSSHSITDSQVGAVSNLTNAANSIVM